MKAVDKNDRCSAISAQRSFNAHGSITQDPVDFRTFTKFRSLSPPGSDKRRTKALPSLWDCYVCRIALFAEITT